MNLPKIVLASNIFVEQAMPLLGITPTQDDQLLVNINRLWANGLKYNSRANIPRAGNWSTTYPQHVLRPHRLATECQDLDTIGNLRAQEILQLNRPIKFFWSGGIDSTAALTWLLNNLANPDQLEVYHTCESIDENVNYVDFIAKHRVKLVVWSDAWETLFEPNDLVVSAISTDNITASVDESFYSEYSDWLQKPFEDYFLSRDVDLNTIDLIKHCMESSYGDSITTTLEARWWFYYMIRHQYFVVSHWHLNLENQPGRNVMCFFDTYEFDAWSQVNRNNFFAGTEWNTYKQDLKDAIYKYWPDLDFNKNKTKQNSYYVVGWTHRKTAQFNQQYMFLYQDRDLKIKSYRPKYWPLVDIETVRRDLNVL